MSTYQLNLTLIYLIYKDILLEVIYKLILRESNLVILANNRSQILKSI
jgi:hypothetical protein